MKILLGLLIAVIAVSANDLAYEKCAGCHGANGEMQALGKSKIIGGQDVNLTIKQLTSYKAGTLNKYGLGGLMRAQTYNMTGEEIKLMSKYISELKNQGTE